MISWSVKLLRASTAIVITGIFGGIYGHLTKEVKTKTLNYHQNRDEFDWEEDIALASKTQETFQRYREDQDITNICNGILISLNKPRMDQKTCETWLVQKMEDMVFDIMID